MTHYRNGKRGARMKIKLVEAFKTIRKPISDVPFSEFDDEIQFFFSLFVFLGFIYSLLLIRAVIYQHDSIGVEIGGGAARDLQRIQSALTNYYQQLYLSASTSIQGNHSERWNDATTQPSTVLAMINSTITWPICAINTSDCGYWAKSIDYALVKPIQLSSVHFVAKEIVAMTTLAKNQFQWFLLMTMVMLEQLHKDVSNSIRNFVNLYFFQVTPNTL